ncbi:MAG TPA: hypothetical protein VF179_02750 [Thermoanaerobaculia bacterium]|nr:hypothetical protein [Thermoanaerobaculia bacterium]
MPKEETNRAIRKWSGIVTIAVAILLYAWTLLCSPAFEPLLVVGLVILLPLGIHLANTASAASPPWEDPVRVRLKGSGKVGSRERDEWVRVQMRRGRCIRMGLLAILVTALALFVDNHVTGSICCGPSKATTSTPGASSTPGVSSTPGGVLQTQRWCKCENGPLDWENQSEREGGGITYPTESGDNLAKIALKHDRAPSQLGGNTAAVLLADDLLVEALNVVKLPVAKDGPITIEEVALRLNTTSILVASRFALTPLEKGQSLKIPRDRPYDPRQWADWLLWTLVGLTASLLIEVARSLRKIVDGEGDFLGETSWYWTQLATGPLVAFVILLLFVHIDVDLLTGDESALEVNLREYPSDLLLVPAFLLGFYSRVAREVLDQIMRRIFGGAWRAAYGDFEIAMKDQDGSDNEVSSNSTVAFETKPAVAAQWSATAGTIDSAGLFTAPRVDAPRQVFITAVATGSNRPAAKSVMVVKHKFKPVALENPRFELHPGKEQKLTIDPLPPDQEQPEITWELVPPLQEGVALAPAAGPQVTLKAPETLTPGKIVTVKATLAGHSRTISFETKPGPAIGLAIEASTNGNPLAQPAKVDAETQVQFKATASDLTAEQLNETKWSAEPADSITLESQAGQEVTGTVKSSGAVIAEHPQKGKARFEITV